MQHREAIATADRCVREVFETVRRLDPLGEHILFITGSDHGMETVSEAIDVSAALVSAGIKEAMKSPRCRCGTARHVGDNLFQRGGARPGGGDGQVPRAPELGRRVISGAELAEIGLPTDTSLQIAVTMATNERINPHGVPGHSAIAFNPDDPEGKIGFGQHGGLGAHEQHPFLIAEGGGFMPAVWNHETSLMDIAPTVLRHLDLNYNDMDGRPLPRIHG